MHANLPDIANRWEAKYGLGGIAELNSQLNSLPEYYLPKNQGGLIPSHEAGIYGLAEGGTPMLVAKRNDGQRPGYGWDPGAGAPQATASSSGSVGGEGYQNVHQTGAVTQTPGRTTTDQGHTGEGWQTYAIEDPKKTIPTEDKDYGPYTKLKKDLSLKGYGPYTKGWDARIPKVRTVGAKEEERNWKETQRLLKQTFGGYGPFTDPNKIYPGQMGNRPFFGAKTALGFSGVEDYGPFTLDEKTRELVESLYGKDYRESLDYLNDDLSEIEGQTADISKADIQAYLDNEVMFEALDNDTVSSIIKDKTGNTTLSKEDVGIIRKYKDKTKPTGKFRIVTAEGGIAGLKQGGRIGFFTGMREAEQEAQSTGGEYQNVHQTGAVSQTPGRIPEGPGNIHGGPTVKEALRIGELKKSVLDQEQEKGGPEYYGLRDLQKKQQDKKQMIKEKIEGEWQRYMDPSTWQKVQNLYAMTNLKGIVQEIFKGIKRTSDMKAFMQDLKDIGLAGGAPGTNDPLYDQLWLHLEKGKGKYRYDDEGGPEGPQETGIKYENIEEFNEDKMAQASTEARQIQEEVDRSKQDAYYAAFRQKYLMGDTEEPQTMFVAQGGRIPGGYNTGGLSNLFRLKNV